MAIQVEVPSMGESVTQAILVKWHKQDGEQVKVDEPLCELETDKANVDVPAKGAGVLRRVKDEGETVRVGEIIARIDEAGTPKAPPAISPSKAPETAAVTGVGITASKEWADALSPAVRKLVEENTLDPTQIKGTGPGGRLTKEDVLTFIEQRRGAAPKRTPPPSTVPPSGPERPAAVTAPKPATTSSTSVGEAKMDFGPDGTRRVPMSKIRKRIAENLVRAQHTAAILTTFNEVDMQAIMDLRGKYKERFQEVHGIGLGFMSFFARAVVLAIREFPRVNASIEGEDTVYHNYVHLGIAVSTERGLAVPVMRNVQDMSFARIENEIKRLATSVRDQKLGIDELSGGTFTITNGGVFGSLLSPPIINPPQSGILGMHAIQKRPVVVNDQIMIRPMMYVALSYDHRLVDGRESVSFLVRMKQYLEDPARLMLEI